MDKFDLDEFNKQSNRPKQNDDSNKDVYFSNLSSNHKNDNNLGELEPPKIYNKKVDEVNEDKPVPKVEKSSNKKAKKSKKQVNSNSKHSVKSTYIFFIVVICISMALSIYAILCMNDVLAITKTTSSVTVSFSEAIDSTDEMIDILAEDDLIKCKRFCKLFVKVRDKFIDSEKNKVGPPYEPGMYYLNGKMGLEGMLITLKGNNQTSETVKLTFPEGFTASQIVERLSDNDVCDKAALLAVIEQTEYNYPLVKNIESNEQVPYRLEGYLFPDTYEFYIGESASSVIKKFLENGQDKFPQKYVDRAKELGYTTDEIMIIASIIQKEAADTTQMKTVSAVLHNRLKNSATYPYLECNSTKDYITNKVAPFLSSTSSHTADYYSNYYNTYSSGGVESAGLPPSPICNPGISAIEAALYPEDSDALFFFHDNNGKIYTSKTKKEHEEKMQQYAPYLLH